MIGQPSRSLGAHVYASVRADVLAGKFASGERLRPRELAAAHQVSLNVVREVLNRLAGEGLVLASPQLGFAVATLSEADLDDLTDMRAEVETIAIRRSIERGDVHWESHLAAAHHLLASTAMSTAGDPDQLNEEWTRAHNKFHAATFAACGSPRLIALTAALADDAAIYRHRSRVQERGERDIVAEHRAILTAGIDHDADLAVRLHVNHIRQTAVLVRDYIRRETTAADIAETGSAPA